MKNLLFFILLFTYQLIAQNELKLDFDYAQFKYDSTSNYVEIYYSFNQKDLTKVEQDGKYYAKAIMHIQIEDVVTSELIVNKDWAFDQEISEIENDVNSNSLLGAVGFILKSGNYNFSLSVEDKSNSEIKKSYTEKITVVPFYRDHFIISDIELANKVVNENVDKNSIFFKNTLEVFPNPSIIFTQNSPILFYYCELYDLLSAGTEGVLELQKRIFNSQNEVIYDTKKIVKKNSESIVDVGAINLKKYPTSTYTLVLTLKDNESDKIAVSSKKFFFVNPGVVAATNNINTLSKFMSSEFGVLLDEECDDLFTKSKIIANSTEIKEYENLDSLDQKREYLYKFWQKRDATPATKINEYKKAFLARVEVANVRYRTMSNPGFKTDRGRVYLKLGEPDQIDRYPNETNSKPYEVWSYNHIEGGVSFVFGDITGFNYYELLHSTKRGEIQDPNWRRRIIAN